MAASSRACALVPVPHPVVSFVALMKPYCSSTRFLPITIVLTDSLKYLHLVRTHNADQYPCNTDLVSDFNSHVANGNAATLWLRGPCAYFFFFLTTKYNLDVCVCVCVCVMTYISYANPMLI